nr:MAG TPA: hypothetical protein [Caudoviricetes sp.]
MQYTFEEERYKPLLENQQGLFLMLKTEAYNMVKRLDTM